MSTPILSGDPLEIVNNFKYLRSLIIIGNDVGDEMTSLTERAKAVPANL